MVGGIQREGRETPVQLRKNGQEQIMPQKGDSTIVSSRGQTKVADDFDITLSSLAGRGSKDRILPEAKRGEGRAC